MLFSLPPVLVVSLVLVKSGPYCVFILRATARIPSSAVPTAVRFVDWPQISVFPVLPAPRAYSLEPQKACGCQRCRRWFCWGIAFVSVILNSAIDACSALFTLQRSLVIMVTMIITTSGSDSSTTVSFFFPWCVFVVVIFWRRTRILLNVGSDVVKVHQLDVCMRNQRSYTNLSLGIKAKSAPAGV